MENIVNYPVPKGPGVVDGHIHANTDMDFWPLLKVRDHVLNAGVDVNGYQPVSFQELLQNNIAFKADQSTTPT